MPPVDPNDSAPRDERTVELPSDATAGESVIDHLKRARGAAPAPSPAGLPQVAGYEVIEEVGRGGMGIVYRAKHLSLNRVVALKMILGFENADERTVARFLGEAEAVAAVSHTNIVQMYELGTAPAPHGGRAQPYFAMEFVNGGTLAQLFTARGPLAPAVAAALVAAAADGVEAAHVAGIVHRDLKPGNILLAAGSGQQAAGRKDQDSKGSSSSLPAACCPLPAVTPKVADFGLAKRLAIDATRTMQGVGTPAYMAPEQADSKGAFVGPGADVYALGAILFECLTGRPPFVGEQHWSVVRQVIQDAPPSPRKLAPAVPRDLELICLHGLEKKVQHRYPTAAALAADLRRFAAGEPVEARPLGALTSAARWAKRRKAAAALLALVVALAVVLPAVAVAVVARLEQRAADASAAHDREAAAVGAAELAEEARVAALKLADAQKLFAIQNKLRTRAADRPLSWTYANRADLHKAVALAGGEPGAVAELRSTAAVALLAADLAPLDSAVRGFTASAAATDPKTGRVAIGEYLMRFKGRVRLVDPATGKVVRELTFTAGFVRDPTGNPLGAPDSVRALAFSPDGARLFVGTRSSRVLRFDLKQPSDRPAAEWKASASAVEQLAVSPDGKTVYGLCRPEAPVFAWAADSGKLLAKLEPSGAAPLTSFALLPTGDIVACEAYQLRRWTPDFKLARTVPNSGALRLTTAPGGALLVGDGPHFDVYDSDALVPLDRLADPGLRRSAHEEYVKAVVVRPGGGFAASCSGDADRTVKVWELASGSLVGTVAAGGTGPIAVAWSGDGNTLVATAGGHLARWAFHAPAAERFACAGGHPAAAAAFAPGGRVATLTEPADGRRVFLVGTPGGDAVPAGLPDRGGNGRAGVAVCPHGTLAVSAAARGLFAWKPGTPVPPPGFADDITWCPRFDPDGKTLWAVVGSSRVRAFDPVAKTVRAEWSNAVEGATRGLASLDALAVGRNVVVAAGRSGSVHLLDATTARFVTSFPAFGDPVLALVLAPDESLIVAGTQRGRLRTIRTADRRELPGAAAHPGGTTAVAISGDGALLATGGRDRAVRLWKRAGDRFEPLLAVTDLAEPVRDLKFGEGNRLLVLLARERAVRVWDIDVLKAELAAFNLAW